MVLCKVCSQGTAQYQCPRCSAPYCSVACYRAHGDTCTESFYRECVEQELRSQSPSDAAAMRQILMRDARAAQQEPDWSLEGAEEEGEEASEEGGEEEGEDDDEEAEALRRVLRKLELEPDTDPEALLAMLPAAQRDRFRQALADGSLCGGAELWRPWWTPESELVRSCPHTAPPHAVNSLVARQELPGEQEAAAARPEVPEELPPVAELCPRGAPPSPLVRNSLVELLAAYACALRLYNGSWGDDDDDDACDPEAAGSGDYVGALRASW
eukprot:m51a1_g75 hypothetical protein (270) ;mRNA; f:239512-240548